MATINTIAAQPVISAAGIYASGDALGGKLEFDLGGSRRGGIIHTLTVIDLDKELAALDLVLFDQDFTPTDDNAPFDPSDADLANYIGHVSILASNYASFNDNAAACVNGVGLPFELAGGSKLYGQLVVRGTPTYTATSDIAVKLGILQDY